MTTLYGIQIGQNETTFSGLVNLLFKQIDYFSSCNKLWISVDKQLFIDQLTTSSELNIPFEYNQYRLRLKYYSDIDCGIVRNHDGILYIGENNDLIKQLKQTYLWSDDYLTRINHFVIVTTNTCRSIICLNVQTTEIYGDALISINSNDIQKLMTLKKYLAKTRSSLINCEERIDMCSS